MKFDDLDKKMRVYETSHDICVMPEVYLVARIDGRNFTKLTKETHSFKTPFDERFRDYMVETVKHLMQCGFNVIYGYTQSDEISLLFNLKETLFSRKHRKYNSVLAGEASAKFSQLLCDIGVFDCRISELPNQELVIDYFRWRNEDANRNALNSHCYWKLRDEKFTQSSATKKLEGMSTADKNELLFSYGINFNKIPNWEKRGVGIYWKDVEIERKNSKLNKSVKVKRKELYVDYELPMKESYNKFISDILVKK